MFGSISKEEKMAKKMKNTFVDFELETGEVAKLTLSFYALLQLKNSKKDVYERYNKIMTKGPQDELEGITILYTAYLCGLLLNGNIDEAMDEEEFICSVTPDREYVMETMQGLINPKKAKDSVSRS